MNDQEKENMRESVYKDMHKGYSEDFNSILNSCMGLLIATLGVLWAYGYVFIFSNNELPSNWFQMESLENLNLNSLCFTTIGACAALCAIIMIMTYQGVAGRKEQFIIHLIRIKSGIEINDATGVFPKDYHPFKKRGISILQSLYGEIVKILEVISICIYLLTFIRIAVASCCVCNENTCLMASSFLLLLIMGIVLILVTWLYYEKQLRKYYDIEEEYNLKINGIGN